MLKICSLALAMLCLSVAQPVLAQDKEEHNGNGKTYVNNSYYINHTNRMGRKPVVGEYVKINLQIFSDEDVVLTNTFTTGPKITKVTQPKFEGDPNDVLLHMSIGDSVTSFVNTSQMVSSGQHLAPGIRKGSTLTYEIKLLDIMSAAEVEALTKKENAAYVEQLKKDTTEIYNYLHKKHIKPERTVTGLFFNIEKSGEGDPIEVGDQVQIKYTGRLLDGSVFDKHEDAPFSFTAGRMQVIPGLDEGVSLLKKGGKAKLYIPSVLAYGQKSPSGKIPPGSILIFEVEVVDIQHPRK